MIDKKKGDVMAIIRWDPKRELDRLFDEDFPFIRLPKGMGWDLSADVYHENGQIVAEMNIPQINPENLSVEIENDELRISGTREEKKEDEDKDYYSKEIRRGSFQRIIKLPAAVRSKEAKAEYEEGVLKVVAPVAETSNKVRIGIKERPGKRDGRTLKERPDNKSKK